MSHEVTKHIYVISHVLLELLERSKHFCEYMI